MRANFLRMLARSLALVCTTVLFTSGCGGGGGGGDSSPTPPPPAPPPPNITYTIDVSATPLEAYGSVGGSASASVTWQFTASPASSTSASYSVTSSTTGVQISNGSGSAVPGSSITTQLTYACSASGSISATLTLSVGNQSTTVSWAITCTVEEVTVSDLMPSIAALQSAASATLVWQFQTNGPTDRTFDYAVTANNSSVTVGNATATASPGDDIQNSLMFTCTTPGVHTVQLRIRVGSASQNTDWVVSCAEKNVTYVAAKFYQGTLIAELEFSYDSEEWLAEVLPYTYTADKTMSLASNRQLFVTLETVHAEESLLEVGLSFSDLDANSAVQLISRSQVPPRPSRDTYLRRNVFAVHTDDLRSLGLMQVMIDPDDQLVQEMEEINTFTFDLQNLGIKPLPEFQLVIVPIVADHGEPDLSDVNSYVDTVYELLPIGPYSVRVREAVNFSGADFTFQGEDTPLDRMWDLWLSEADRSEYYHGIFVGMENVRTCGIAFLNIRVGVTAEKNAICSDNTIAHEIGHNLSLLHAPACGAEDSNADSNFPHMDGSIGLEGGWLMLKRRPVGQEGLGATRIYDTMSYCLETFTSRYSYAKAHDFWAGKYRPPVSSSSILSSLVAKPPKQVAVFDVLEGRSFVLSGSVLPGGEWSMRDPRLVEKEPHPPELAVAEYGLELVHAQSGSVLHQESLVLHSAAHRPRDIKRWGLRIPAFDTDGLYIRVIDREGSVVFSSELKFESVPQ